MELVFRSRFRGNGGKKVVSPTAEIDGFAINIQFFVVEIDFHTLIEADHEQEHEREHD